MKTEIQKTKIHHVYKLQSGERVPSVTTILAMLNKPGLLQWAWQCGVDGTDYRAVRDSAGDIGTLAHLLIIADLRGEKLDTSEYSQQDIEKAETCLIKYWDWLKGHRVKPIMLETPLVSEEYGFGGTVDFFGNIDGQLTLVDFKTGKAIYEEAIIQVTSYSKLLLENNCQADTIKILRIGRNETEGFEERTIYDFETGWQIFRRCLDIYRLRKGLKS